MSKNLFNMKGTFCKSVFCWIVTRNAVELNPFHGIHIHKNNILECVLRVANVTAGGHSKLIFAARCKKCTSTFP